jgi:cation-transporting ATPase F
VVVNAGVGLLQESKAEAALDALREMVRTSARVTRDGKLEELDSEQLVPGDLVQVAAGDKVPADIRLTAETDVEVDESALTGESVAVAKDEVTLQPATVVADRRNMLYSGTLVTRGSGEGVVVATGATTELGQIHRLVGEVDPLTTPLTLRLNQFSKILTAVILVLALVTFGVGVWRGEPWPEMFNAAVALAVGAIPEGLPAAVTITLAIGVGRMARRRAVVRRLPAVETLGSTTVICTDKTGTLTENVMTVVEVWTPRSLYHVTGVGYDATGSVVDSAGVSVLAGGDPVLRSLVESGVLCSDAHLTDGEDRVPVGDPTEGALLVLSEKLDIDPSHLRAAWVRNEVVPFSSEKKCMRVRCAHGGVERVIVKGAVERVLSLCDRQLIGDGETSAIDRGAILETAEEMAARGLRILAVAERGDSDVHDDLASTERLAFVGLVAMHDPPRAAAASAVEACHTAGISVKMITGDHASTAVAIARSVGLVGETDEPRLVGGPELAQTPSADLPARIEQTDVFARVTPEQKLRLVGALQEHHHVVAMTGDGVNDAPALRQADIGVAMGYGGTEVAKEASDMVLTDDDFATIEAAVEEGRGVFDNLTKFIVWTLPTNMGEGFVVLTAILAGVTLPILPVQILWINMTTAVALGLMLAFEPKEAGIMTRPPRDPHAALLSRALVMRIVLVSAVLVAGSWSVYSWELASGSSLEAARTAAVNLFVVVEAFYLINCRSLNASVWTIGWFSNRWVIGGLLVQAVGQLGITYLPVMNGLFDTAPIGIETWLRIFLIGVVAWIVVTVDKRIHRGHF